MPIATVKEHAYGLTVRWTGNTGSGTSGYRSYEREHVISAQDRPEITMSSDPAFRGDKTRYSPEELLVASVSSCHMLWFLHLCADSGIVVVEYMDYPTGIMEESSNGAGSFREITLNPKVTVSQKSMLGQLEGIHKKAHNMCFISNSVNFTIQLNPAAGII